MPTHRNNDGFIGRIKPGLKIGALYEVKYTGQRSLWVDGMEYAMLPNDYVLVLVRKNDYWYDVSYFGKVNRFRGEIFFDESTNGHQYIEVTHKEL